MDDDLVAQFVAITEASAERAHQYLRLSDGNIEQAVELYYSTGGIDLGDHTSTPSFTSEPPAVPPLETRPQAQAAPPRTGNVVDLDSDEDISDDEPVITGQRKRIVVRSPLHRTPGTGNSPRPEIGQFEDEDAAMARRLQEEIYAGAGIEAAAGTDSYRAPIAPTRETLVGPEPYDLTNPQDLQAALDEQIRNRERFRARGGRGGAPGIFNQRPLGTSSVWEDPSAPSSSTDRRSFLARSTAGASETSSKSTLLAELYRPPFELMSRFSWEAARQEGKDNEKWILVNVQDPAIFDCQILNRDLWKNGNIQETIRENFIFIQYSKDDPKGSQYTQYYFQNREIQNAYPHIAIVDPRTGEQVKVWSGPPPPKPMDFLSELHEFLDRYSLNVAAKNPVARRKPESRKEKAVDQMTEEEMLEMALQNSLAGTSASAPKEEDPDALTRSIVDLEADTTTGKSRRRDSISSTTSSDLVMTDAPSTNGHLSADTPQALFAKIPSTHSHTEPPTSDPGTTRIQFRHPNGRVVRRFALSDPVQRIYEWLKASPLEGKEGVEFELVSMGRNLMEAVSKGESVEDAGLRNGTVMIEFVGSGEE